MVQITDKAHFFDLCQQRNAMVIYGSLVYLENIVSGSDYR